MGSFSTFGLLIFPLDLKIPPKYILLLWEFMETLAPWLGGDYFQDTFLQGETYVNLLREGCVEHKE